MYPVRDVTDITQPVLMTTRERFEISDVFLFEVRRVKAKHIVVLADSSERQDRGFQALQQTA